MRRRIKASLIVIVLAHIVLGGAAIHAVFRWALQGDKQDAEPNTPANQTNVGKN